MKSILFKSVLWAGVMLSSHLSMSPVWAAERLTVRIGPIERSIQVSHLEKFVETGKLSDDLELFEPLLGDSLREALGSRLDIDPNIADTIFDDLLATPAGDRLLKALMLALPENTVEEIKAALKLAIESVNGLSLIGIFKAFPAENLTVDLTGAIAVATRLNTPYWETQILSSLLKRELTVETSDILPNFDPAAVGSFSPQQQTLNFVDRDRQRAIAVDIYWGTQTLLLERNRPPANDYPLVVMSHGFGGDRTFLAYLARHLASHGITVVSLEHPGSNREWLANLPTTINPSQLLPANELIDRPLDVTFVLNELEKLNLNQRGTNSDQPLPAFNTNKVVAIGHSLGGYTVLALAGAELNFEDLQKYCQRRQIIGRAPADWLQCAPVAQNLPKGDKKRNLGDRRVVGAIGLNPVIGQIFGENGLKKVNTPTLLLASTNDPWTPAVTHQLRPFLDLPQPKYLITAIDGTHYSATDPDSPNPIKNDSIFENEISETDSESERQRQLVRGITLAFIQQHTSEAKTYQPFLTATYAQSLSTDGLPLRLNTEIPSRLALWLKNREEVIGNIP
jgi:predicted dienelactone hydrolase